jgi:hypothetical protein
MATRRVPPGLPERTYTLVVALPDGSSCRLGDAHPHSCCRAARRLRPSRGGLLPGRPQLVIEAAGTQPEPVSGGVFSLTLQIVNRGTTAANNAGRLGLGGIAIEERQRPDGDRPVGNAKAIELELLLARRPLGYQNLALALEYPITWGDLPIGPGVGISINTSLSDQPLVLLSFTTHSPSPFRRARCSPWCWS